MDASEANLLIKLVNLVVGVRYAVNVNEHIIRVYYLRDLKIVFTVKIYNSANGELVWSYSMCSQSFWVYA